VPLIIIGVNNDKKDGRKKQTVGRQRAVSEWLSTTRSPRANGLHVTDHFAALDVDMQYEVITNVMMMMMMMTMTMNHHHHHAHLTHFIPFIDSSSFIDSWHTISHPSSDKSLRD
jgi:hypothetical protein